MSELDAVMFPGLTPAKHRNVARFLELSSGAQRRFDECSEALGYDLQERYEHAEIYDWEPYQIAFLAINLSLVDWATSRLGLRPHWMCGQSFGGFVAAVAAGCLELGEMVGLLTRSTVVETRFFNSQETPLACLFFARINEEDLPALIVHASSSEPGGWARVCVRGDRGVLGVSGTAATVAALHGLVRAKGGIVYYEMNRAEHCPELHSLSEQLKRDAYAGVVFRDPVVPMISDVLGEPMYEGHVVRQDLLSGWTHMADAETLYAGLTRVGVGRIAVLGPSAAFRAHGGGRFVTMPVSPAAVSEALS